MQSFEKDGYVILLEKDVEEPIEHHIERGYFVVSQKPKTKEEYDNAVLYSRIYINKSHKQCKYSEKIEKIVTKMCENMLKQ